MRVVNDFDHTSVIVKLLRIPFCKPFESWTLTDKIEKMFTTRFRCNCFLAFLFRMEVEMLKIRCWTRVYTAWDLRPLNSLPLFRLHPHWTIVKYDFERSVLPCCWCSKLLPDLILRCILYGFCRDSMTVESDIYAKVSFNLLLWTMEYTMLRFLESGGAFGTVGRVSHVNIFYNLRVLYGSVSDDNLALRAFAPS